MRRTLSIVLLLSWTITFCQEKPLHKAVLIDINYFYEYPDFRIPFDHTRITDCNPSPLRLDFATQNRLVISLTFADCYTSEDLDITIDSSLNILSAKFLTFSDNLNENENRSTTVEDLILYFNKNPFHDTSNFIGHFSAIIQDIQLQNETHYPFHGKFKVYSDSDRALNAEQLRSKMESEIGFVDENGVFELPESDPQFCYGEDSLTNFLKTIVLNHSTPEISSNEFYFTFIINESGKVDEVFVKTKHDLESGITNKIEDDVKNTCWIPAVNYGQTVKSTIYPWIEIK